MQELDNLISFCLDRFNRTPFCEKCQMSNCFRCDRKDCYKCLKHIHHYCTIDDRYSCEKITYNYILKFGHRYASEIAWAVAHLRSRYNTSQPMSFASVGCGPSTELYGIIRALPDTPIRYLGFDRNELWRPIQEFNIQNINNALRFANYQYCDFFSYVEEHDLRFDILILNYFFSDFVKYSPDECEEFINRLVLLLQQGRFSSVIINDVMLTYLTGTGYSCMEKITRRLRTTDCYKFTFYRRHFAFPNQFQVCYGEKVRDLILFDMSNPDISEFEPFSTCGSIQLIINAIRV